jgi:DNA-binding Lrp family transcriptional regulator
MTELPEESVIFARVKPGEVERAMAEMRRNPKVRTAEPVMGTYDLAISGTFASPEELQEFRTEIEQTAGLEETSAYPGLASWSRNSRIPSEQGFFGWTLIRAADPDRAMKELQKIPSVNRLMSTTGEYNLIARISAQNPNEIQEVVLKNIQRVPGIERTETLPGFKQP